ncbi:MAG TPA: molecular chaperone DnaJ [Alphaproteobacteria bacterium]|nr:molecular chaperone DnaJ [Alphaproteobacteria bacterium]
MGRSQLSQYAALQCSTSLNTERRVCEWPGCDSDGEYRAPRSRSELRQFRWFCLGHVRTYNQSWNFFSGLNEAQIEEIRRRDTVWDRPSWPLGGGPSVNRFEDPLGLFGTMGKARPHTPRDAALAQLGLDQFASIENIKARYKSLAKKHHPDANGGSKNAEKKFVAIQEAYNLLINDAVA